MKKARVRPGRGATTYGAFTLSVVRGPYYSGHQLDASISARSIGVLALIPRGGRQPLEPTGISTRGITLSGPRRTGNRNIENAKIGCKALPSFVARRITIWGRRTRNMKFT